MNRDFSDMLSALSARGADYLLVGAYALAVHGVPRATGDLDLWLDPTLENARKVWQALGDFGAPRLDLRVEDLAVPGVVFQIGVVPCRIDLLTEISGVQFREAWMRRCTTTIDGLIVPVLSLQDLQRNKRASGRPKDLADLALLAAAGLPEPP